MSSVTNASMTPSYDKQEKTIAGSEEKRHLQVKAHPAYDSTIQDYRVAKVWLSYLRPQSYVIYSSNNPEYFKIALTSMSEGEAATHASSDHESKETDKRLEKACHFFLFKPDVEGFLDSNEERYSSLEELLKFHQALYPAKIPTYYDEKMTHEEAEVCLKKFSGGYVLRNSQSARNSLVLSFKLDEESPVRHCILRATLSGYLLSTKPHPQLCPDISSAIKVLVGDNR